MRKAVSLLIVLIFLLLCATVFAGESKENSWQNWSSGNAYLMPAGRMSVGLFQSLRYGWSQSVEFSAYPLAFILMPNLNVKWAHDSFWGLVFTTRHNIYYPTPLLRVISKEGIGGIISPEFDIPHIVSLYNEVLLSKEIAKNHLFTGKAGVSLALKFDDLDERTTIDLPLIFSRMGVYYNGYGIRLGGDLQGKIKWRWSYLMDADLFFFPGADEDMAFEHKWLLLWTKSPQFQLCVGYKLVYGEYPFGTQWHLLIPIFDLQWAWRVK